MRTKFLAFAVALCSLPFCSGFYGCFGSGPYNPDQGFMIETQEKLVHTPEARGYQFQLLAYQSAVNSITATNSHMGR